MAATRHTRRSSRGPASVARRRLGLEPGASTPCATGSRRRARPPSVVSADTATGSGAEPSCGRLVSKEMALRAKSTVATMRAQLRPLPLAQAMSNHSPTPSRPKTMPKAMAKVTKPSICDCVSAASWPAIASSIWVRMASAVIGVRSSPTSEARRRRTSAARPARSRWAWTPGGSARDRRGLRHRAGARPARHPRVAGLFRRRGRRRVLVAHGSSRFGPRGCGSASLSVAPPSALVHHATRFRQTFPFRCLLTAPQRPAPPSRPLVCAPHAGRERPHHRGESHV